VLIIDLRGIVLKKLIIILLPFILLIFTSSLPASDDFVVNDKKEKKDTGIRIKLGPALWGGYTTYRLGYPKEYSTGKESGHFPYTELQFPITSISASLTGEYDITRKISAGLRFDTNLTGYTGKMEDSNWYDSTGKLDEYSESNTDMRAYLFDLDGGYSIFKGKKWWAGAGGGLIYRYFSFECSDTETTYPSGDYGSGTDTVSGVAITYQAQFLIPYLQGEAGYSVTEAIKVAGKIGVSPYLLIWDRDEHIARVPTVYADGTYSGYAFLFSFQAGYRITSKVSFSVEYSWIYITAEGEQDIEESGNDSWTTAAEIESNQYMLILYAGYSF
jgi:hypothetical protein